MEVINMDLDVINKEIEKSLDKTDIVVEKLKFDKKKVGICGTFIPEDPTINVNDKDTFYLKKTSSIKKNEI